MIKKNVHNKGVLLLSLVFLCIFFIGAVQLSALAFSGGEGGDIGGPSESKDDCGKIYPNPVIKFDHRDAAGKVHIPVGNWSVYPNEMFRKANELPPCGANFNSSRTWVDIYNADTNARIYGFCAFDSNDDLKGIWFSSSAKRGRVYIIIKDRACKKNYKSNAIRWP